MYNTVTPWSISLVGYDPVDMTWGNRPWSRVTIKTLEIKVVFVWGKSVQKSTVFENELVFFHVVGIKLRVV